MDSIFENLYVNRELHSVLFNPVCQKYKLTPAEILVLLFLSKNNKYNTATDMVEKLKIAKSHVSVSVRDLEERGYIKGSYEGHNHRTIHLQLCDSATDIIADAIKVQEHFVSIICQGFSEEEINTLRNYFKRITNNVNTYLKEYN